MNNQFCFEPRSQDGVPRMHERGITPTLNTAKGGQRQPCVIQSAPAVVYSIEGHVIDRDTSQNGFGVKENMAQTLNATDRNGGLVASDYKDPPTILKGEHSMNSIVRRLTPLECTRLQGFPDGWVDIGDWLDSKGKFHKDSDSPKYAALGNSIALPFWEYLARRIAAQYERPATMASLFDGIGGFPLAFERAGCKAVWASEIEEFPMAVTKYHFGEE